MVAPSCTAGVGPGPRLAWVEQGGQTWSSPGGLGPSCHHGPKRQIGSGGGLPRGSPVGIRGSRSSRPPLPRLRVGSLSTPHG